MKTLRRIGIAVSVLFALAAVLHLPGLRPYLAGAMGCPFPTSTRTLTRDQVEALRVLTFASARAQAQAAARPALGFSLGEDARASLEAWAKAHAVSCKADKFGAALRCLDVPASALPTPVALDAKGALGLGFDAKGKLVSVQYEARTKTVTAARAAQLAAEHALEAAGPLTRLQNGSLARPLSQQHVLVAQRDFRGEARVTHMGDAYAVSQSYQLLP